MPHTCLHVWDSCPDEEELTNAMTDAPAPETPAAAVPEAAAAPTAPATPPAPAASAAPEAPAAPKVKARLPFQRACNEKNAKGKLCAGHLKRWFGADKGFQQQHGGELYRCEHCQTIYTPTPGYDQRSGTLQF